MNEYLSRSEISPVDRVAARAVTPVAAVPSATARASTSRQDSANSASGQVALSIEASALDEETAGAAEYAKVHARIADILADMRSGTAAMSIDGAEASIQSMLPAPIILVPLPPASREAVEHAVQLAKRIAQQAFFAHAAQAHLKRGTVDQILATRV
ncbi:MAG: hypothetical protein PSY12_15195 [bacterium]|nr:hypothetical protein [bacterium]